MPLFDLSGPTPKPFRRVKSSAEVFESEIEQLFWENLEAFAGEPLFALGRQVRLPGGGIPDILALDSFGRVVVIEIKRDVDRGQLAQCLEYAGWARRTSLDELARLYRTGPANFFADWQSFTQTPTPLVLDHRPRLELIARAFDPRTESALRFLQESGVPVTLIAVSFHEDGMGRRVVDLNNGSDIAVLHPPVSAPTVPLGLATTPRTQTGITLADLLEAGVIEEGENLVWRRPQVGELHEATVNDRGEVILEGGRVCSSLSTAANTAAGGSNNGWKCWTVPRLGGVEIGALRTVVDDTQPT